MKVKSKIRDIDSLYYILYAIIFIPFLAPYYFLQHEIIGPIIDCWIYLAIVILSVHVVLHYQNISSPIILILSMYTLLLCVTFFYQGEVIAVIKHSIKVILLCCLIDIIKYDNKKMTTLLYVIRDITMVLFIINLLACIIWNKGMPSITQNVLYPYHLFGNVNTTIRVVLPGMLCSTLINHRNNRKYNAFSFVYLIGFIYIYLNVYHTTTTIIAVLILTIWILFESLFSGYTFNIYVASICAILVLEILVVIAPNMNVIGFITGVFNKSTDFTGRAKLWSNTMDLIREHPVFGIGRKSLSDIKLSIGNTSGSHNYFLDILYQRGIVGLSLFLLLGLKPVKKIKKSQDKNGSVIYILVGYCICLFTMFLSEPFFEYEYYFVPIFYALYIFACIRPHLQEEQRYEI